ncbi:hypothetical protein [Nonomuraea sp. NPDC049709]|uniref:hypothetical protein n=1 Tax=Nonomuraea sp. NPDC049709 TaxID=3154736 RepID=UPI003434E0B9
MDRYEGFRAFVAARGMAFMARRFLQEQATIGNGFAPAALTGADINAFRLRECERISAGSAKGAGWRSCAPC